MSDIVSTWVFIEFANNGQRERHILIPETLGQFTGLKDKNGVDIYEGDVLNHANSGNFVVRFEDYGFHLFYHGRKQNDPNTKHMEVIDNIHSNPELNK